MPKFTRLECAPRRAAEGVCYLCGRNGEGLDTGVQIVGEGDIFICRDCIKSMAILFDFETKADHLHTVMRLKESVLKQAARIDELKVERDDAVGKLAALQDIADTLFPKETPEPQPAEVS